MSSAPSSPGAADAAQAARIDRRRADRRRLERRRAARAQTGPWRDLHQPARFLAYLLIILSLILIYENAHFLIDKIFCVLLLFIFAAIIALLVNPLVDRIERMPLVRGNRGIAVLVMNAGLIVGLSII